MWVRGLKHIMKKYTLRIYIVAPHVGAWIETDVMLYPATLLPSHPMWVRGLKQVLTFVNKDELEVAPHVGAWIETKRRRGEET